MNYDDFNQDPGAKTNTPTPDEENGGFRPPEDIRTPDFMPHTQSQERMYRGDGVDRREDLGWDRVAGAPFTPPAQGFVPPAEEPKANPWDGPKPWGEPEVLTPDEVIKQSPKASSGGKKTWPAILISAGVAVVASLVICVGMMSSMNTYWHEQNELLKQSYDEKLNLLQKEYQNSTNQTPVVTTPEQDTATPPVSGDTDAPTVQDPVQTQPVVSADVMTPAQVYAQCVNSVVAINCKGVANGYGQSMETSSSGSGFILSEDGYVVTNFHVVEGQTELEVLTYDGTTHTAQYIGGNEANDIALIKMDAQDLTPVKVGASSNLVVGEQVVAIGNPLGELASTLTVGYISAKDRVVATDGTQINMLQTDAAINPGNSGGPLFNMKGEVIGITSAKYSGTTNSGATIEGIGFAIPTDDVMGMLEDLRNHGYITGGYLGISASDVDPEASQMYGLPSGALVRDVTADSCADKAGIKAQDIITNIGGYEVKSLNDLSRALNKLKAGETVTVTVYRSGKEQMLSVVLDERPKDLSDSSTNNTQPMPSAPSADGSIDDWFDFFLP